MFNERTAREKVISSRSFSNQTNLVKPKNKLKNSIIQSINGWLKMNRLELMRSTRSIPYPTR